MEVLLESEEQMGRNKHGGGNRGHALRRCSGHLRVSGVLVSRVLPRRSTGPRLAITATRSSGRGAHVMGVRSFFQFGRQAHSASGERRFTSGQAKKTSVPSRPRSSKAANCRPSVARCSCPTWSRKYRWSAELADGTTSTPGRPLRSSEIPRSESPGPCVWISRTVPSSFSRSTAKGT